MVMIVVISHRNIRNSIITIIRNNGYIALISFNAVVHCTLLALNVTSYP